MGSSPPNHHIYPVYTVKKENRKERWKGVGVIKAFGLLVK